MISDNLLKQIDKGREGKNWGYSMGLPKLESVIDGVTQQTYTLIFSPSGTGKIFNKYLEYCRLYEESYILLQIKNGKICIDNSVLNSETKKSESVQSVEIETDK